MYHERDGNLFESKKEFKGFVIGCVLGGNTLGLFGQMKEANFTGGHSLTQKEYCQFKARYASYLTKVRYDENGRNCSFQSMTHPFYTKLREHFYFGDRVGFDEHIMKCLTPMGLSMWYQNDGNYSHEKKNDKYYLPVIRLCSRFGDSHIEHEYLQYWLKKRFDIKSEVHSNKVNNKKYWLLRIRKQKDIDKFIDIVKPWIVPSMKYKTPDAYEYKVSGMRRDSPAVFVGTKVH